MPNGFEEHAELMAFGHPAPEKHFLYDAVAAFVGEMGPPDAQTVSAIGDTVNTAARLEGLSKELGKPIIVSEDTVRHGKLSLPGAEAQECPIRGRQQPIKVYAIDTVPADL